MLVAVIGIAIGVGLPVQTSVNARLRRSVGSPFLASLVSFGIGTLVLGLIALAAPGRPGIPAAVVGAHPWWIWTGGLLGVVFLTGNLLLLPVLGAVQTVVLPVFGQITMGLAIDALGWFGGLVVPLGPARVVGALLVAAGVVAAVVAPGSPSSMRREEDEDGPAPTTVWAARALGLIAGAMSATQTAVNGRLGQVLGSPAQSALVSFAVGTVALTVLVLLTRTGWRVARPDGAANPWWMWIGGVLGAAFVLGNVFLVGRVGTGVTVLLTLTGSITGSLLVDHFGWLGTTRARTRPIQVVGVLAMLAGAALTRLG